MNTNQPGLDNTLIPEESKNEKTIEDKIAKQEADEIKSYFWWSITGAVIIGIIMIGLISGYLGYEGKAGFVAAFGSGVLIAGGSILGSGFLGFIFGIPSILQDPEARLKYNDNLIQISDWLTKIIVGVGLTQLYQIPHFIIRIGEHFQMNFGGDVWGRNVAIAILGYYFILGFLMIYFWTKTDYSTIMKFKDDDFNKKLRMEQEAKKQAQQAQQESEQKLAVVQKQKQQTENQLESIQKDFAVKEEDMQAFLQTFSSSVDNFKTKKEKIDQSPDVESDPQKGKWGGKAEANDRKVSAFVRETSFNKEWFNVNLEVVSTNENNPLTGEVKFHIHPSFPHETEIVNAENGMAKLQLVALGAFTVGIECDNGVTQLEIDLAELPDAPQLFKER